MLEMLWTFMAIHPVFINVPISLWMFLTLWNLGTILFFTFFLYSLIYLSCGDDIYGTSTFYLPISTNGTIDGATLPLIIFWACASMLSCFFLTLDPKAPPSSILFFFLRALLGNFATTLFLYSNVTCISSLILLALTYGFCGFSFWWINIYLKIFTSIRADW